MLLLELPSMLLPLQTSPLLLLPCCYGLLLRLPLLSSLLPVG